MTTAVAGPDLDDLRELQGRALEAVARRWADDSARPGVAAGSDDERAALRRAAAVTGLLAEAARQAASAAAVGPAPWPYAVETADAISTTALALRMLAELELGAIPGP